MAVPWLLLRWEVEYLEHVLEGRTRPLVLRCSQIGVNPNPVRRSLVVKAVGLPEVTRLSLIRELLGNILARELGVYTSTPALVEIDAEVADALNVSLSPKGLRLEPGIAVGCTYLRPLLPVAGDLPEQAAAEVPRLYGFDLAVQNPDRRVENPNCALFENQLFAYDFEMAFSFLMLIGNTLEPWEVSRHGIAAQHLLYPRLRGRNPNWQPLLDALRVLTKERLEELIELLPPTWRAEVAGVRIHLSNLLGSLTALEDELQESVI